jgi:fused signal recognition particle receptor
MGLFDKIFGKKVAEQIEENASADIFKFDLTEKEATTDAETAPESKSVIVSEPISEIEIEPKSVSEKEIETMKLSQKRLMSKLRLNSSLKLSLKRQNKSRRNTKNIEKNEQVIWRPF